jgi:hypothetical protein
MTNLEREFATAGLEYAEGLPRAYLTDWSDSVHTLAKSIRAKVRELKREGTTGMSRDNLKMIVSTAGLTIAPNPSAFARCFEQALEVAEVNGFVY